MVQNISVIGSGIMGRGIAYNCAIYGYNVTLHDLDKSALANAQHSIETLALESLEKGYITRVQKNLLFENVHYINNLETAVIHADLVIEAIIEKMDEKIDLFRKLDSICPEKTILATNTSSLSPTEIAAQTARPDQVIAMHFFNPVHKMKLIEIIRGLETSDETVQIIKKVASNIQKESIEVTEFPGFVTSRMNVLIGNEAMNMLMEGVASAEDIDKAVKLGLNHPMGPLELGDLVGLDTRLRTLEYLHKTLGEKYRPSPLLVKYVKAGRLGRKSGHGIYEYNKEVRT
ncbi:3-hydroxyacyl-CoA dehydrogenase NAD-binding domain-containing protein [Rummeliibacillus pycnus]|uniref:3-hydroxyacyl-CoA dehydrogenase NAD-binding domain-containing protein n=1 Tax=Rummeliibacillus pycnus TaxID=101070 RepID=UPI000C9A4E7C|nr:3-hydroxyacyl-CoA dehydrogenase NAD-binding domain-containing protein [Rummeliibacillus pycnus]